MDLCFGQALTYQNTHECFRIDKMDNGTCAQVTVYNNSIYAHRGHRDHCDRCDFGIY